VSERGDDSVFSSGSTEPSIYRYSFPSAQVANKDSYIYFNLAEYYMLPKERIYNRHEVFDTNRLRLIIKIII